MFWSMMKITCMYVNGILVKYTPTSFLLFDLNGLTNSCKIYRTARRRELSFKNKFPKKAG
jgi:hypothetical protein